MNNLSDLKSEYKNMKPHLSDSQRKDIEGHISGADTWNRVRIAGMVLFVGGLAYLAIIS